MNSTHEARIEDLLRCWIERHDSGETLSADDLCRDCPEVLDEVRARVEQLRRNLSSASEPTTVREGQYQGGPDTALGACPDIPGYTIEGVLGKGGMGVVYLAHQPILDRHVALKTLHPPRPGGFLPDVDRFRREAQALGRLEHPGIVRIYSVDQTGDVPFFVMELVGGGSLKERLEAGPLPPRDAAALVAGLARAVQAAHEQDVLHRDLKPSNVLLTADGVPKIADFGLAKRLEGDLSDTPTGQVLGTPSYMSPEQAAGGKDIGPAADVYGLGAVLYECLAGRPPFKAETMGETISDVLRKPPRPVRSLRPGVSRVLEAICLKCLEKAPARRYSSALALAEDLDNWLARRPTVARPLSLPRRWLRAGLQHPAAIALVLLLVVAGILLAIRPGPPPPPDPDAVPRRMKAELLAGQPVALIGPTGSPRWMRWSVGEAGTSHFDDNTQVFTLQTFNASLATLLPAPGVERYLFRAEVSHDQGTFTSDAGIFFGLQTHPTPEGDVHVFCAWTFNDQLMPVQFPRRPVLNFNSCRNVDSPDPKARYRFSKIGGGSGKGVNFEPSGPAIKQRTWRSLAVEVAPEKITAIWEGKVSHSLDGPAIRKRLSGLYDGIPGVGGGEPLFVTDAPLGLYILEGSASFRNVVVEPR